MVTLNIEKFSGKGERGKRATAWLRDHSSLADINKWDYQIRMINQKIELTGTAAAWASS